MTGMGPVEQPSRARLFAIDIDDKSIARNNANIEHEREVAIFDLLDGNSFTVTGRDDGPYRLRLSLVDNKLQFDVGTQDDENILSHGLSLTPFKRIIKDYFMVCDSYYEAIRSAPPSKIQAIDMGRRSLHDEGSRTLQEKLSGKIDVDFDTARRLFTLVSVLHWKG
ncbi:MAG: UPF0262 family protein [Hyphomicrobiaceae bacterium]|nr:UPF0262 family protein [Hyphomicrobiaceae bacterium]MCC0009693.1 UPF0262 family protein [Hyphomicrobiaceae bacterium]